MTIWLLQLVLVIALCNVCGRIAERLGQCAVVGEIAAGLLLGPSLFGVIAPGFYDLLFGPRVLSAMAQVSEVGLILLMFQVGLHMELGQTLRGKRWRMPVAIAAGGLVVPAAIGMIVAIVSKDTLASDAPALPYVLFCGVALAVSAVPVMARIIDDLALSAMVGARHAMSAAMLTDALGWMLLATIASLSSGPGWAFARMLLSLLAYLLLCALLVRFVVRPTLARLASTAHATRDRLAVLFCFVIVSALATSLIGFHSAFGALAAALFVRRVPGVAKEWRDNVEGFVKLALMPVFFAYAGLHASIGTIDDAASWMWFGVFLAGGFIGKFGGSYLGARATGLAPHDAMLVSSLMNTRGLMELIVLSIGLQMQILPPRVYTILVVFALVTTALTAPLVRFTLRGQSRAMSQQAA
ncbi:sodium/hydrogen exchanger [Pseudomonas chlororaphis subsp. aurantiaca]|uniref:cation:proton antiporter n=1 Tax=Pseudomonas chlororaphis TaxID=587753 RepID=UPI000F58B72C|nr:cation:proton antiporter [Pseudomonas chlororaphis]AZD36049.1 sodium/hydrogen exchanger [Pseudomonas chlororaphis subsp. aurantiaca]AZD42387.1 sodium/hydrogen exchanger [Pseudomonas chlororaphis subsp. aurantiaca]AZD79783.1 sodium/hydrogen exchanger [Pseudomonas chlororaphis subsp. aurantiaca]